MFWPVSTRQSRAVADIENIQSLKEKMTRDYEQLSVMILAIKATGGFKFRERFRMTDEKFNELLKKQEDWLRSRMNASLLWDTLIKELPRPIAAFVKKRYRQLGDRFIRSMPARKPKEPTPAQAKEPAPTQVKEPDPLQVKSPTPLKFGP